MIKTDEGKSADAGAGKLGCAEGLEGLHGCQSAHDHHVKLYTFWDLSDAANFPLGTGSRGGKSGAVSHSNSIG